MKHLRVDLFTHMESLPIKYFDTHAHGDIMSSIHNDVDTLRQLFQPEYPSGDQLGGDHCDRVCQHADPGCAADPARLCDGGGVMSTGLPLKRKVRRVLRAAAEDIWGGQRLH